MRQLGSSHTQLRDSTLRLATVSALAVTAVVFVVVAQGHSTPTDGWYALPRLLLVGLIIVLLRRSGGGFGAEHSSTVRRGLLIGGPAYLAMALSLVAGVLSAGRFAGWGALILFTLSMISVGTFEEALFRGVVLRAVQRTVHGRTDLSATLVSSAVFGVAHLVNLPRQGLGPTVVQIAYATMIGVFFAAVRIRSRSLIAVIVLHTMLDWSFYLGPDVFPRFGIAHSSAVLTAAVPLLFGLLLGAWGVCLLRRPSPARS